jgi:methionyl-tRNA synthetase
VIRCLAIICQPFMPVAMANLLDQLGVPQEFEYRQFASLKSHPLRPGTPLPKPEGVFPRYVEA